MIQSHVVELHNKLAGLGKIAQNVILPFWLLPFVVFVKTTGEGDVHESVAKAVN